MANDEREQIADDINAFVKTLTLPVQLPVLTKDNVVVDGDRVRISYTIAGDINITVDVARSMLMHLAMMRGFLGQGG